MNKDAVDIKGFPFFKDMDADRVDALARKAEIRKVNDLEVIFRTGQPADSLFVILSGRVQLLSEKLESGEDPDPQPCIIRKLEEGETFGWSCLVPPHQWRLDAEAAGRSVLLVIDGRAVREDCAKHPGFGFQMLQRVAQLMLDRLYAAKFQMTMHSGKPYSSAEGA